MPNHSDHERAEIYAEEAVKLRTEIALAHKRIAELTDIRKTCIRALAVATSCSEEEIEVKPFECAFTRARQFDALQARLEEYAGELSNKVRELETSQTQFDDMVRQRDHANALLFDAGKYAGEQAAARDAARRDAGLVVHALDCAIQLIEALFIFLPEGTALPSAVATCKHNLDAAMTAIRPGNISSSPSTDRTTSDSSDASTTTASTAGSWSPSAPATNSPSSSDRCESEKLKRANDALALAGQNIATLVDQRDRIVRALDAAMVLINALMGRMRSAGTVPDPLCVAAKARLDLEMRALLQVRGEGGDATKSEPLKTTSGA